MGRIGGIYSLTSGQLSALNRIRELGAAIAQNSERLTTLKRINSAKDDPAGLVRASLLQQELAAAEAASAGITRANALLSTADEAASEILTQLQSARTLALEAAGGTLSSAEVAANQVELDTILESIDALSRTEFGGRRLLDGSSGYRTSGADSASVLDVDVLDKADSDAVSVAIEVTRQAEQAADAYDNSAPLAADTTLIVTGSRGSTTITLSAGASTEDLAAAFNAATYLTGVEASASGSDVELQSTDYGSDAVIEIEATEGTFTTAGNNSVQGGDAEATINGQEYTADGTSFSINTSEFSAVIELDPAANGAIAPFTISGEGLAFLVGTSTTSTARIGLPNLSTSSLGGTSGRLDSIATGGANSLTSGNTATTLEILDNAIADVTRSQALIGSFQRFALDSSSNVLAGVIEHTSEALSAIVDADVALESALLSNNQLLQQTAYQALSITGLQNQEVLSLLQASAAR